MSKKLQADQAVKPKLKKGVAQAYSETIDLNKDWRNIHDSMLKIIS